MKRLSSSDSLGGLISICPTTSDQNSPRTYGREFQSMLDNFDEEASMVEDYSGSGHVTVSEKKRRLSVPQVKALEKNFELENKLEPERKVKLAHELGLQPRQVAVWFQNRRARWKTKQLEKDYGVLKGEYDALRLSHDALQRDNETLLRKISELKAKLNEEDANTLAASNVSVKEEETSLRERNHKATEQIEPSSASLLEASTELNYHNFNRIWEFLPNAAASDSSDSSAVLNEDNSPKSAAASASTDLAAVAPVSGSCFQFVKIEEEHEDFLSGEEACGFFSDEQPPSLHWYSGADQWN